MVSLVPLSCHSKQLAAWVRKTQNYNVATLTMGTVSARNKLRFDLIFFFVHQLCPRKRDSVWQLKALDRFLQNRLICAISSPTVYLLNFKVMQLRCRTDTLNHVGP